MKEIITWKLFQEQGVENFSGLWGCVIISVIVISLTGVSFLNKEVIAWLPCQLVGLVYTPHFLSNYGFGSYNGSLWTIPVELQFYILLPVCYRLVPKNRINHLLFGLLAVFTTLNFAYQLIDFNGIIPKLLQYSFIPHFYLFLVGVIFQRLRIYKYAIIYNKAVFWLIVYITFTLTLPDYLDPEIFSFIYSLLLAFCVLSMAYTIPGAAKKLLGTNDISYGTYIYHGLILTVIVEEKLAKNVNIYMVIILTYIMAYLSWVFIEKPFLKRKRKTIRAVS